MSITKTSGLLARVRNEWPMKALEDSSVCSKVCLHLPVSGNPYLVGWIGEAVGLVEANGKPPLNLQTTNPDQSAGS